MKESARCACSWLFVGTIPEADYPLTLAPCTAKEGTLFLGERACSVHRGTPAMLAAAAAAYEELGAKNSGNALYALVAGDTGNGAGSRAVYEKLLNVLPDLQPRGVTFHYLLPDVDWHNRILLAMESLERRPLLAADAGYMYAAKMSGYAQSYDLFTPDIGELAFLADDKAPHPFYTRNFLLADEARAEELVGKAYACGNAARHLLVKGKVDRYVHKGKVLAVVDSPDVPMLEPVGGTGDTVTGIVSALLAAEKGMGEACTAALKTNRRMGYLAHPTPASSVSDLLLFLPSAVRLECITVP